MQKMTVELCFSVYKGNIFDISKVFTMWQSPFNELIVYLPPTLPPPETCLE